MAFLLQLKALNFHLPADGQGARRVPPALAEAVWLARSEGRELETLRADPTLRKFLTREAAAEIDPAALLITLSGEVALVRAVVGALVEGTRLGTPSYWRPPDWAQLNLPHPLGEL